MSAVIVIGGGALVSPASAAVTPGVQQISDFTVSGVGLTAGSTASTDGSKLYVSDDSAYAIQVVRTTDGALLSTIPLGTGQGPTFSALSPDGSRLYVPTQNNSGIPELAVIDTATNTVIHTTPFPAVGLQIQQAVVSPDGTRVYVSDATINAGRIFVFDASGNQLRIIPNVPEPLHLAISPDGGTIYAGSNSTTLSGISRVDLSTDTVSTLSTGDVTTSVAVSPDGSTVYAPLYNGGVAVIDASTFTVTGTIANAGISGRDAAVSPNGRVLYVAGVGPSTSVMVALDTQTGATIATIDLGATYTITLALSRDGTRIFSPALFPGGVLRVAATTPPTISASTPSNATAGTSYSFAVPGNGTSALRYAVTSGALPPGLQLDPTSGAITGAPTSAGSFPFTITATDQFGSASAPYAIAVAAISAPSANSPAELVATGIGIEVPLVASAAVLACLVAALALFLDRRQRRVSAQRASAPGRAPSRSRRGSA